MGCPTARGQPESHRITGAGSELENQQARPPTSRVPALRHGLWCYQKTSCICLEKTPRCFPRGSGLVAVLLCHPPARCSEVRAPGRCPWGIHGACGVLGWGEEVWDAESRRPSGSEQLSRTTGSPGTESASYPVLLTPSCKANLGTQGNPRAALGASGLRCLRAVPAIQSGSESALEHRI